MVVLHALGQCLIRTAITTITPRADMCFALASYLTRERGNRVPRRRLEKLFWPRMRAADASHSLSELIHKLRRKGVVIHRDEAACIWLPREAVAIDIESLRAEPARSIASRDLSVLPGYEPRASAAFSDWVDEWRAQMRLRVLDDVIAAIRVPEAAGDWQLCLELADQAIRIDPDNEAALLARARAASAIARQDRTPSPGASQTIFPRTDPARFRESHRGATWSPRRSSAEAGDTPFVGRDDVMKRLLAHATPSLTGAVRSAYVSGQAGVGKSRMVRELSAWMRARGASVCLTSCSRHDGHRPLSAFVQSVSRLQQLPGAAGCSPEALSCLESITQLSTDSPSIGAHDDSSYRPDAIRESIIDLINAIAHEQPLLLVLEDVHWTDPASWSLLRTIAATAEQSVLIVCTSRVRWQHSTWGEPDMFVLEELVPLEHPHAVVHMRNCVAKHARSVDDAFVEWCVETSSGNPYFIEELVNYWITTGEQYSAPPLLVALVEARLACLTPHALRVIQAAAILGRNSNLELLQRVLEFPTHVLLTSIEELGETGLLTASPSTTGPSSTPVLCRHDIVLHAATRGLSAHGRALLHHAAAKAIESRTDSHSADLLWDCADHWRAAGQIERAIRAAITCARHLHDMGLVHDAIKSCESALAMCQDDLSRAAVLRAMAQSQYSARDWGAFCGTVASVRTLESDGVSATPVHDDLELYELGAQRNLHRNWTTALNQALLCVQSPAADVPHRLKAAITALKLATNVGALDVMDLVYREIAPLVDSNGGCISDRLSFSMIYHAIRGDTRLSACIARELLAVAANTLPPRHRLTILADCSTTLRRCGLPNETAAVCEELFRIATSLRCFDQAADACHRAIEVLSDSDYGQQADEWVLRYARLRRPKRELSSQPGLSLAIVRVHLRKQEWSLAEALLAPRGRHPLWDDPVTMLRSSALAMKIRLEMGLNHPQGDVAKWVAKLEPLNACLRSAGAQDYEAFTLYSAYRYLGSDLEASAYLKNYVEIDRRDVAPLAPEIRHELRQIGNLSSQALHSTQHEAGPDA